MRHHGRGMSPGGGHGGAEGGMSRAMGGGKRLEGGGADEWRERVGQLTLLLEAVRGLHAARDLGRPADLVAPGAPRRGKSPEPARVSMSREEGIAGLTARTGRAYILPDAAADPRFSPALDRA